MFMRPLLVELGVSKMPPRAGPKEQVEKSLEFWTSPLGELKVWVSGRPFSRAAASVKALNVEPAWKPLASPYSDGTV